MALRNVKDNLNKKKRELEEQKKKQTASKPVTTAAKTAGKKVTYYSNNSKNKAANVGKTVAKKTASAVKKNPKTPTPYQRQKNAQANVKNKQIKYSPMTKDYSKGTQKSLGGRPLFTEVGSAAFAAQEPGNRYFSLKNRRVSMSPLEQLQADAMAGRGAWISDLGAKQKELSDTEKAKKIVEGAKTRLRNRQIERQEVSEYDRKYMNSAQIRQKQEASMRYKEAQRAGDKAGMEKAHRDAENLRKIHGYSGGVAGNEYISPDVPQDVYNRLNNQGITAWKQAQMDRQKAVTEDEIARADKRIEEILKAPGFRKGPATDTDTSRGWSFGPEGRRMWAGTKEQNLEDARQGKAALLATGEGALGSLLYMGQITGRAERDQYEAANINKWIEDADDYISAKSDLDYIRAYKKRHHGQEPEGMSEYAALIRYNNAVQARAQLERIRGDVDSLYFDPAMAEYYGLPTTREETFGERMLRQAAEHQAEATEGMSGAEKFVTDALISTGQSLPGMALGVIPGVGPALGLGVLGLQAGGSRAYDLTQQGLTAEEALRGGLVSGGIEILTEKLPLESFAKIVKGTGGRSAIRNVLKQAGLEGSEEAVSYVGNWIADEAMNHPEAEFSWAELLENAGMGAVSGGVLGVGGSVIGEGRNRPAAPERPQLQTAEIQAQAAQQAQTAEQLHDLQTAAREEEARQLKADEETYRQLEQTGALSQGEKAQMKQALDARYAELAGEKSVASQATNQKVQADPPPLIYERSHFPPSSLIGAAIENYRENKARAKAEEQAREWEAQRAAEQAAEPPARQFGSEQEELDALIEEIERYGEANTGSLDSPEVQARMAEYSRQYEDIRQKWAEGKAEQSQTGAETEQRESVPEIVREPQRAAESVRKARPEQPGARETLLRASLAMGKSGRENVVSAYTGEDLADYHAAFSSVYTQALGGRRASEIARPQGLTMEQYSAAVEAGNNDRAASLRREIAQAARAAGRNRNTGLVMNQHAKAMDRDARRLLTGLARSGGTSIEIVDPSRLDNPRAQGQIDGNRIMISTMTQDPVKFVAGHEVTHRMQDLSPETYRAFRDYVMQRPGAQAALQETLNEYTEGTGKQFSLEAAMDELTANYAGDLFESSQELQQFIRDNYTNKTLLERVLDAFRALAAKLTGREKAKADEAVRLLEEAMRSGSEALETLGTNENTAQKSGGTRYSTKAEVLALDDVDWMDNFSSIKQQLQKHADEINAMDPVAEVSYVHNKKESIVDIIMKAVSKIGGGYMKNSGIDFVFDLAGARSINAHATGPELRAASLAAPYVAKYGKLIAGQKNHEGKGLTTLTFAAPVRINGTPVNVGVAVQFQANGRPRAVNVGSQGGGNFKIKEAPQGTSSRVDRYSQGTSLDTRGASDTTIQQESEESKRFSLKAPVEETKTLVALHNLDAEKIDRSLRLGAFPAPSIAVVKAKEGHSKFGPISIVFPRSTIDPEVSRKNRVYGSDAWTPTHSNARVEYPVNYDALLRIEKQLDELSGQVAGGTFRGYSLLRRRGLDDDSSMDRKELAERLSGDDEVRAAYLAAQGRTLEPVMREKEFDAMGNDFLQTILDTVGEQEIAGMTAALMEGGRLTEADKGALREIWRQNWIKSIPKRLREKRSPEFIEEKSHDRAAELSDFKMEQFVRHTWDYYENHGVKGNEIDRIATSDKLREAVNDADVAAWIEDQLDGLLGEPGVYNGKEPYTASGNKRSFATLHYPYTAEGIVRAMYESTSGSRGQNAWGVTANTLISVATPEYGSVDEIHADEDRLRQLPEEKYKALLAPIDAEITSFIQGVKKTNKAFAASDYEEGEIIASILMDNAGKKTAKAIQNGFRKEGYTLSPELAKSALDIFQQARAVPTGYFEAKPERAVRFDEVLAAVVPSDLDEGLRKRMEDAGMRLVDYEAGDDQSRLDAVNSVEGAQFSLAGAGGRSRAQLMRENEILQERVNYWKSQVKRPDRKTVDPREVQKLAKEITGETSATMKPGEIARRLENIYNGMRAEWSYDRAYGEAAKLARDIVEGAEAVDDTAYREYEAMRTFFRKTPLVLSASDREQITDYNEWRKSQMGKLRIQHGTNSNIDQVFQEAAELWPEWFSEDASNNPADQLERIAEVLGGIYARNKTNPFADDLAEAVDRLALHILEQNFTLPSMQDWKDAEITRMAARFQERQEKTLERAKQRMEKRLREQKDLYLGENKAMSRRQMERELRGQIIREAGKLTTKLVRGTDKNHVPKELRSAVATVLDSINLSSRYAAVFNRDGKYEWVPIEQAPPGAEQTKRTKAFEALREQFQDMKEDEELNLDPSLLGSAAEDSKGLFEEMVGMRDIPIGDLELEQLRTVWKAVRAIERAITTYGKTMASEKYEYTRDWARDIERDTRTRRDMRAIGSNKLLLDLETPYTFFSQLGEAGKNIFRMLRNAQDLEQRRADEIDRRTSEIVDPKTVKEWKNQRHTFTVEWVEMTEEGLEARSENLVLTTDQIMDLYNLSRRPQSMDHLLEGGIVQPEVKGGGRTIYRGGAALRVDKAMVEQIVSTLTEEQKAVAKKLQAMTTGVLADWGNEASMKAYGYEKFGERHYWPIHTAKEANFSSVEKNANNPMSVKNFGLAKNIVPHARNPLDLMGVFDNFGRHAMQMITYATWLNPMEDANRLYNWTYKDAAGNQTGRTMKQLLDRVAGRGAQTYWLNLMTDIQNGISGKSKTFTMKPINKIIGNAKGAAVGMNLRVVIQQPTAIMRALAVMNPADLAAGVAGAPTRGSGWKKAEKWAGIAARKAKGSFDLSGVSRSEELFFGQQTTLERLQEASGKLAGAADKVTWGKIWNAAEWQVKRQDKGLEPGSDAYYERVAEVFTDTIDQTQVVDGVLQRSQMMRDKGDIMKQATAFMGEPIMSMNLLLRSWNNWRYQTDPKKRTAARKTMGRAATAFVVNCVVNALAQSIWDGIRDDDDDRSWLEGVIAAFIGTDFEDAKMLGQAIVDGIRSDDGDTMVLQRIAQAYQDQAGEDARFWGSITGNALNGNLAENLNPLGSIPFLSDAVSIVQGYDVTRADADIFADIFKKGKYWVQAMTGDGKNTRWYATVQLAAQVGKLFGIPASTVIRDISGGLRTFAKEFDNVPLLYEVEKAIYSNTSNKNKSLFEGIAWAALEQGDLDTFNHIREDLMNGGITDGKKLDEAMKKKVTEKQKTDPDFTLGKKIMELLGIRTQYAQDTEEEEKKFTSADLGPAAYEAYSRQRAASYYPLENEAMELQGFRDLSDADKDKVLKTLWKYADETALAANSGGQYEVTDSTANKLQKVQEDGVVPVGVYSVFAVQTSGFHNDKDANGKTIQGSKKKKVVAEIANIPGLTNAQRRDLYLEQGFSEKTCPF